MTTTNQNLIIKAGMNVNQSASVVGTVTAAFFQANIPTSASWANSMTLSVSSDATGFGAINAPGTSAVAISLANNGLVAGSLGIANSWNYIKT
jgi:hypothetical protein